MPTCGIPESYLRGAAFHPWQLVCLWCTRISHTCVVPQQCTCNSDFDIFLLAVALHFISVKAAGYKLWTFGPDCLKLWHMENKRWSQDTIEGSTHLELN